MTTEPWFAASRERLRRACEDAQRLYDVRMHGENGETIADGNRIDGILTLDLPDALGAYDRLVLAFQQACSNLASVRPESVMEDGEDLSLGECAARWQELVYAQSLRAANSQGHSR